MALVLQIRASTVAVAVTSHASARSAAVHIVADTAEAPADASIAALRCVDPPGEYSMENARCACRVTGRATVRAPIVVVVAVTAARALLRRAASIAARQVIWRAIVPKTARRRSATVAMRRDISVAIARRRTPMRAATRAIRTLVRLLAVVNVLKMTKLLCCRRRGGEAQVDGYRRQRLMTIEQ